MLLASNLLVTAGILAAFVLLAVLAMSDAWRRLNRRSDELRRRKQDNRPNDR
jgi:hypothetical protein